MFTTAIPTATIDSYRLKAVVHGKGAYAASTTCTTYRSSQALLETMQTTWTKTKEPGSGGFGDVTVQEDQAVHCWVVKRLLYWQGVNYAMELMVLSMVADVGLLHLEESQRNALTSPAA